MLEKEFKRIKTDHYFRMFLFLGGAVTCLIFGLIETIKTGELPYLIICIILFLVLVILDVTLKELRKPQLTAKLKSDALQNTSFEMKEFEPFDFSMIIDEEYTKIKDYVIHEDCIEALSIFAEKMIARIYRLSSKSLPQENDQLQEILEGYEYSLSVSNLDVYLVIKGDKRLSFDPMDFKTIEDYYQRFVFEEEIIKRLIMQSK